jgi:hypothetical protein
MWEEGRRKGDVLYRREKEEMQHTHSQASKKQASKPEPGASPPWICICRSGFSRIACPVLRRCGFN